jgi:predicted TIM-barrel fold metal-dependent hydrolase
MHIHPFCKEANWGDDIEFVARSLLGTNKRGRRSMEKFFDVLRTKVSIKDYVEQMDKWDIEKAVIVSYNLTTAYGVCIVTNDDIADFVTQYSNRFIGYACIDIPAPDALQQLEYAIESLDLKGVKVLPPGQKFDISDSKYNPLWEKMIDLDIPLWTHTAQLKSIINATTRYGHPLLVDELAIRYPQLTIVMGHMGVPWMWDAWSVVERNPNVYVDISAYAKLYPWFPFDAYSAYNLEQKVLFASDHPLIHWNEIIPAVKALPISEGFKRKILYDNAKKLLRL